MPKKTIQLVDPVDPLNERPQVCLVDLPDGVSDLLKKKRYSCTDASTGSLINVPKDRRDATHLLQPDYSIPKNIHEYDIVVLDMGSPKSTNYESSGFNVKSVSGKSTYALLSRYPQQIFDSRPFGLSALKHSINDLLKKKSLVVVFADTEIEVNYEIVEINAQSNRVCDNKTCSSLQFCNVLPEYTSKFGKIVKAPEKSSRFTPVVLKYMEGGDYKVIFKHPGEWNGHKRVLSEKFFPIAINDSDEIVSYAQLVEDAVIFVFPQIRNKGEFILEFFDVHMSELFPQLFPYSGQFGWLEDGSYPLPGEIQLRETRLAIEEKYKSDVSSNETALQDLKTEFSFLRDLITATGDELVKAVEEYFAWLGFPSVKNMDDHDPETLEEDIQVDFESRLLVVEVKGIGGTSTDKACSQISKIKYRRSEERGRFDVFGLYVVNHQRYISPKDRTNPPFTSDQIKDARLDKRGLVTTYELYKAYFLIVGGVLDKGFVRERLFDIGLIDFYPSELTCLGVVEELFKNGCVAIVSIEDIELSVGTRLIAKKGDSYSVHVIKGLQVNGAPVEAVSNGEVGISMDKPIRNRSELFIGTIQE